MELVGAAFEKTVGTAGASTGPDILLFKRFQQHWPFIDRANFKPAALDLAVETLVAASRQDILAFADDHLELEQPRDDYREFLELRVIFLGGTLSRGIHFQLPGAMHRARWSSMLSYWHIRIVYVSSYCCRIVSSHQDVAVPRAVQNDSSRTSGNSPP